MDERERNITDAFIAMREFDTQNAGDYSRVPDAVGNFTVINEVIDAVEGYAATQTSGGRGRAVERKAALIAVIRRQMKDISRTARALNFDDEGFRRLFRIPENNSDPKLLAAAREFASEATAHQADFLRLAMPANFIDDLNADITDFEQAVNQKANSQNTTAGATAGIDAEIERGMRSAVVLDAILQNVYRNNPMKLAEWTRARHIRRSTRRTPQPPTQP